LTVPLPRGQLEWLKLPSPLVGGGGAGVGWEGTVAGGVDEEGELPPPQDEVRRATRLAAATVAPGFRLRRTSIDRVPP